MKKIFVASPVRGGVSPEYVRSLITLLFSKLQYHKTANPDAPFSFDWGATSGTSVAMARDELVHVCVSRGFDGILWHDIDLGAFNSQTTLSMYARLLSHIDRVDIVAGQYVGHNFLSQFHGATVKESTGPDEYGLLEMEQVPLGFSYVSTKAFLQVMKAHPERQYMIKETCMKEEKRGMFEFHPNGIAGPCSAHGKLARIKEALKDYVDLMKDKEKDDVIFERFIDPRAGASEKQAEEGATNIMMDLEKHDITVIPSSGIDIENGIQLLNNLLSYDENKPIDSLNAPKMYVSDRCQNFIYAMTEYTGQGGRTEATKDPIDAARYIAVMNPEYIDSAKHSDAVTYGKTGSY